MTTPTNTRPSGSELEDFCDRTKEALDVVDALTWWRVQRAGWLHPKEAAAVLKINQLMEQAKKLLEDGDFWASETGGSVAGPMPTGIKVS